jgi:glycine cleavage system transcriptional repressor
MISVYGADQPGIVASVAKVLAEHSINITDVETKATGAKDKPLYVMLLEVTAPSKLSQGDIERSLKAVSQKLAVDITVQSLEVLEL